MTYCQSVGSLRVSRRPDLGDGGLHVVQSLLQVVILVVYVTHLQLPLLNVERVNSSLQVIPSLLHLRKLPCLINLSSLLRLHISHAQYLHSAGFSQAEKT